MRKFSEQLAELMVLTGMPRMTARVFVSLYVTDSGTLGAAELVSRLRVSPASVSASIGYLTDLGLVRREQDPTRRRELYVADDDIWLRSLLAGINADSSWSSTARLGVQIFGAGTAVGHRLAGMGQFFDYLTEIVIAAIQNWHEHRRSTGS